VLRVDVLAVLAELGYDFVGVVSWILVLAFDKGGGRGGFRREGRGDGFCLFCGAFGLTTHLYAGGCSRSS
jgi:hypothetical protein